MNRIANRVIHPLAAALVLTSGWAFAQTAERVTPEHKLGAHPAVIVAARGQPGIDPNRFIVGHPASPQWRAVADEGATALAAASGAALTPAGTATASR